MKRNKIKCKLFYFEKDIVKWMNKESRPLSSVKIIFDSYRIQYAVFYEDVI